MTHGQIQRYREETAGCAAHIHLNNAGAALPPRPVVDAQVEYLQAEALAGGYETADARQRQWLRFYRSTASLLHASPREIAFTGSATDSFVRALSAIPFEAGDIILTTADDYASNHIAFLALQKRLGVKVLRARQAGTGGVDLDHFLRLLDNFRPKLVAVTHMPTNSGLIQPVETIGQHCRELDCWYLVDACQTAGQLPLDVEAIGCDFLSGTYRKYLRGPRGAGFLFVSQRALDAGLEPLFPDLYGAHWTEPDSYTLEPTARRFEWYERSYAAMVAAHAANEYALEVGLENIALRVTHLAGQLRQLLAGLPRVRVLDQGDRLGAIVTCHIQDSSPKQVKKGLSEHGINHSIQSTENALLDFESKGVTWALRLSPHYYNTEEELDQCAAALKELLRSGQI